MLVNLATILGPAVGSEYSVGCFNVFGWEDAQAVVTAATEVGAPVILGASADFRKLMPIEVIAPMLRAAAEQAPVPVCVHLDHTYNIAEVFRAVENIAGTRRVAQYAHAAGCSVEAEIGSVPYAEGRAHIKSELTELHDAVRLAAESGLDAMAVSIGNVHRLKEPAAVIDFKRLEAIEAAVTVPLVIHGTSGIFEGDIARLARTRRIAKFNIATVLRQAFGRGLRETLARNPERFDRVEIMGDVMPVMSREASRMIRLLGWKAGSEKSVQATAMGRK